MNFSRRRVLAGACGAAALALLLVGCTGSAPPPAADFQETPPPADAGQQDGLSTRSDELHQDPMLEDASPPEDVAENEVSVPASPVEEEGQPEVSAPAGQTTAPPDDSPDETPPPTIDPEPVTGPSEEPYVPRTGDGVDVIYFEPSKVCSCTARVGDAIERAVLTYFQDELQSGELRYFFVVSNDPSNDSLMDLFDSQPLELRIIERRDGETTSEAVTEIWSLKSSPSAVEEFAHAYILSLFEGE